MADEHTARGLGTFAEHPGIAEFHGVPVPDFAEGRCLGHAGSMARTRRGIQPGLRVGGKRGEEAMRSGRMPLRLVVNMDCRGLPACRRYQSRGQGRIPCSHPLCLHLCLTPLVKNLQNPDQRPTAAPR